MAISVEPYTMEQAETDIANLRALVDRLTEILSIGDSAIVPNTPGSGFTLFSASNVPGVVLASGLTENLSGGGQVSIGSTTVAGVAGDIASITVPANDMITGAVYELVAFGNGTFANPAGIITFAASLNSVAIGIANGPAAAAFSAGAALRWTATARFVVRSTGTGGTLVAMCDGTITMTANNIIPGTAADNSVPFSAGPAATTAVNTTISNTFDIRVDTSGGTGGTLTAIGAYLKRVA